MAKLRDLPLRNYPNGSVSFGPYALGLDGGSLGFLIGRCTAADPSIWPNASTVLTFDVQFSFDGGTVYTTPGLYSGEMVGGIVSFPATPNSAAGDFAESGYTWDWFPERPTHMKGTVTITGGPLRSYLDVTGV